MNVDHNIGNAIIDFQSMWMCLVLAVWNCHAEACARVCLQTGTEAGEGDGLEAEEKSTDEPGVRRASTTMGSMSSDRMPTGEFANTP